MSKTDLRWYVYLVRCGDGTLYAGCTNDLRRRVTAHNAGRGAKYTRSRLPVELVFSQSVDGRRQAQSLEAALKRLRRIEKMELVGGSSTGT